jgi:hypothetical protein
VTRQLRYAGVTEAPRALIRRVAEGYIPRRDIPACSSATGKTGDRARFVFWCHTERAEWEGVEGAACKVCGRAAE